MLLPRCAIQVIDSGKERVDGFREQCAERKGRGARETSCAVGVRVGRTGGAAVKQGGMGGIARLRTRGRRAAYVGHVPIVERLVEGCAIRSLVPRRV